MSAFITHNGNLHFVVPAGDANPSTAAEATPIPDIPVTSTTNLTRPSTSGRARSSHDQENENADPSVSASSGPQRRARGLKRKATAKKGIKRPEDHKYRRVLGALDRQVTTENREFTLTEIYYGITTPRDE